MIKKIITIITIIALLMPIFFTSLNLAFEDVQDNAYEKSENEEEMKEVKQPEKEDNGEEEENSEEKLPEEQNGKDGTLPEDKTEEDTERDTEDLEEGQKQNESEQLPEETEKNPENSEQEQLPSEEQDEKQPENEDEEDLEEERGIPNVLTIINNSPVIKDGIYEIATALDNSKVIEVQNGSCSNSANVQLSKKKNVQRQRFEIIYNVNEGVYTITALHADKVLDVANGGTISGSNVQQYQANNTEAQKWIIQETGDGYYNIISKKSGLYLDIANGSSQEGANVQIYEGNGTKAQKFAFRKVTQGKGTKTLEDGVYSIHAKSNQNIILQVQDREKANEQAIQLVNKTMTTNKSQNFVVKYLNNGYYSLTIQSSNKAMDVPGSANTIGTGIQQYDSNNTTAQQWIIQDVGSGYYSIISRCNGLYIDIPSGNVKSGQRLQLYDGNNTNAQKFKFKKVEEPQGDKVIEEGVYYISSALLPNKVLDIAGGSSKNDANLQLWERDKVPQQQFRLKYDEKEKAYTISPTHSNKVLDVQSSGQNNGTNVGQYQSNNTLAQKWIIKQTSDGYYYIISKCNYLYLDIAGAGTQNGTNIQVYDGNGTNAQKFKFVLANSNIVGEKVIENGVYKIHSSINYNKVIDIQGGYYNNGANVQLWEKDNVQQQKFEITYNDDGKYYEIKSVNSGKSLDIVSNQKVNGTNVQQYDSNGSEAQRWVIQKADNNSYYIVAVNSGLYLDLAESKTDNGTNIQIYEGNGSNAQKFKFERVTMIDNNSFKISIKKVANRYFDIAGGTQEENGNLQIWSGDDVNQQIFKIEYIDKNYCKIISRQSNKVLTVKNNNVVQATYNNLTSQQWSIEIAGNGYYKIKSRATGKYMEVYKNGVANATNVQVNTGSNTTAQMFKFNVIGQTQGIDVSQWNGFINWSQVKNSGKVDFAMIRAAYRGYGSGKIVTDPQFLKNATGAVAQGINIGLYFFTQAINEEEAKEEANYVLNLIKSYNLKVTYPIVIDTEYSGSTTNGKNDYLGRADNLDKQTRTAVCKAFAETIKKAGYTPAVYASRDWFYNNLEVSKLTNCDIWLAHYTGSVDKSTDYKYSYQMWQYTSSGSIPGVNEPVDSETGKSKVDMNICYKNY